MKSYLQNAIRPLVWKQKYENIGSKLVGLGLKSGMSLDRATIAWSTSPGEKTWSIECCLKLNIEFRHGTVYSSAAFLLAGLVPKVEVSLCIFPRSFCQFFTKLSSFVNKVTKAQIPKRMGGSCFSQT